MKRMLTNLWTDDCGALLVTEWIILATLIVIGIVPGMIAIRNGLLSEMKDVSNATMALDQSYEFTGNELVPADDYLRDRNPAADHRHAGNGSVKEIVKKANNGNGRTTTVARNDGRKVDSRDPNWREYRVARTGGSAFIQGNHTTDGREFHSSNKYIDIKGLGKEKAAEQPQEPIVELDD